MEIKIGFVNLKRNRSLAHNTDIYAIRIYDNLKIEFKI